MRSILVTGVLALVCHQTYSQKTAKDDLQMVFDGDYCPTIKLYNGETLDLGCFDNVLGFKPLKPKYINPVYSLYKSDNALRCVRQWRYDEPLTSEADDVLNSDARVALIVHGFRDRGESDWMVDMTQALFMQAEPEKQVVIIVDWNEGAAGPNYARAASNVFMLARTTAEFLMRLKNRFNLDTDKFHLIGHSLGAQTVGHITKWLNVKYGIRVGRATGLDVAAPLFEERSIWPRRNDSKFLEGYHTSSGPSPVTGDFGLTVNFAHVDVYPNGGKAVQPSCPAVALDMSCSHNFVRPFYTDFLKSSAAGCQLEGQLCGSVACAEDALCQGGSVDLINLTRRLAEQEAGNTNRVVYIDTQSDAYTNRCANQNTTKAQFRQ